LNISSAINVFFRQAIREQSIPFTLKPYDDYYTGENLARLKRSMEQSEGGKVISFTMSELEAMETGEIPQRAIEFLEKLSFLAGNQALNKTLVIETNLTTEEKAVIKAGRKERKEHPENFTPWATVRAEKNSRKTEPASPEEAAMINKRVEEYEKNPSSFVPRRKRVTR